MVRAAGYPIDYVVLRDAGRKSWFANRVSLGYAFMNPNPGVHYSGPSSSRLAPLLAPSRSLESRLESRLFSAVLR
ncbi:hypothetical protein Y032_0055g2612 [Ancylostoma ceylanicum]|uniref:Uncharacterized protein n=1 Tax=Ancylostoma ceylanicum TaxID=53326 RepID=A0A016U5I2_9BILA|nr:hypothetical protein Y032_0055g2612 [Ancylostoma ceylanicum]